MKIALLGNSFISWGGGVDFLRNVANALLSQKQETNMELFLLIPEKNKLVEKIKNVLRPWRDMGEDVLNGRNPKYKKVVSLDKSLILNSFKNIEGDMEIIVYRDSPGGLISCLEKIGANVVIPSATSLGRDFPIPWVGYIFDFQHKYYPNFFTKEVCHQRDVAFNTMLTDATAIIVNAQTVKDDIIRFFPETNCEVFNLPFAPTPISYWFDIPKEDLSLKYALPEKYFIMCNQFWVHKSHITAFEALKYFRDQTGMDVSIVCTGNTFDIRFPNYFCELQKKITELGIEKEVMFLGFIPKADQIQIMRKSLAVLQPTLFEGGPGGGAVYDAVAMGVPAVVSDIPVNKEIINEDAVAFFKTGSSIDMTDQMRRVIQLRNELSVNESELFDKGQVRCQALGERLLQAIHYVLEESE